MSLTMQISDRRMPHQPSKSRYSNVKSSLLKTVDPNLQKTLEIDEKTRKKNLPDIIKMSHSTIKDLSQLSKKGETHFLNSFKESVQLN